MSKPRLLDLFCGAGGAAMGYHRAGFEVVGVDIKPQPHYPFRFMKADALMVLSDEPRGYAMPWDFDVIHASPPCQHYSSAGKAAAATYGKSYADEYAQVRDLLRKTGLPWVIENVDGAPTDSGIVLCGSMFGLDIQRHRSFESSDLMLLDRACDHGRDVITVTGHTPQRWLRGKRQGVSRAEREAAMGIDWMTVGELTQAVPPAYTEWLGAQLMAYLNRVSALEGRLTA